MPHSVPASECPNWSNLSDLSSDAKRILESHIEQCSTCQDRYARAVEHAETDWLSRIANQRWARTAQNNDAFPAIPGFIIERRIAAGGQGVVYLARDIALRRQVAIKHLKWERLVSKRDRKRLSSEAAAAAGLEHPNVLRIHHFGDDTEIPYVVMEFLAGGTLAQRMKSEPLTPREAAELVLKLALAVQYAHERRIIHRDLKPSNILFTDNTLDTPKIVDFGIAKQLPTDGADLTPSGLSMGTPQYIAPEVISQKSPPSPQTDVYSFGAILYVVLTGRLPFDGLNAFETLNWAAYSDPTPPREFSPGVPVALESICLRCLERDPQHRYPSAQALADDLQRYLRGEPISVDGQSSWNLASQRFHPAFMKISSGILAIAACVLIVWAVVSLRAEPDGVADLLGEQNLGRAISIAQSLEGDRAAVTVAVRRRLPEFQPRSIGRRNATLFLAADDPSAARSLVDDLLDADDGDVLLLLDYLSAHRVSLVGRLWEVLLAPDTPTDRTHRIALAALLRWESDDARWSNVSPALAQRLLDLASLDPDRESPIVPRSKALLDPLLLALTDPQAAIYARRQIANQLAASATADAGFRQSLHDRISGRVASCRTLAEASQLGTELGLLALGGVPDLMQGAVASGSDPTVATAALSVVRTHAGPEHIEPLLRVARRAPDIRLRRWALACVASIKTVQQRVKPTAFEQVRRLHETDPDGGIHGLAEVILLRWNRLDLVRKTRDKIRQAQMDQPKITGGRRWYIGPNRTTMMLVPSPKRTLAISMHEVSRLQYEDFLRDHKGYVGVVVQRTGEPVTLQSLNHVRSYCNNLSRLDGLEPCYQPDDKSKSFLPCPDYLTRTGYRLPTVEEWKAACFAEATTPFPFGRDLSMASLFGQTNDSGGERSIARYVSNFLPNDYGLFDMIGNAAEMCEDPVTGTVYLCGGSFADPTATADNFRIELKRSIDPDQRAGFRVVRTIR